MNGFFSRLFAVATLAAGLSTFNGHAVAQEAPDALVKHISQEVIDATRSDKEIQGGNRQRIMELVEAKILPHVDFQRTTALAAGRYWRDATPEQQARLTNEFRTLIVYTYSSAMSQIKDQKIVFKPLRADPADTEVEVRSQVIEPRGGDPLQINYRLAKSPDGWKIYDVSVLGAWLVETYKGSFSSEISKGGFDGLIKALSEKNMKLASNAGRTRKAP